MKLKTDNLEESVPCFVTITSLKKIKVVEPIVAGRRDSWSLYPLCKESVPRNTFATRKGTFNLNGKDIEHS